jgi:plasmid maintenance system antidote protein VapI
VRTRKTLSMPLNGKQGLSAGMALRLSRAFKTTTALWMNLQNNYDLWYAQKNTDLSKIKVFRLTTARPDESALLTQYASGK